jgi:hypothetical protein
MHISTTWLMSLLPLAAYVSSWFSADWRITMDARHKMMNRIQIHLEQRIDRRRVDWAIH